MAALYGYERVDSESGEFKQVWTPTDSPDALLLPDARFVPAETEADAIAALQRRYPFRALPVFESLTPQRVVKRANGTLWTAKYPAVSVDSVSLLATHGLEAVAAWGGALLDPFDRRSYRYPSYSQQLKALRNHPEFRASELIVRTDKTTSWEYLARSTGMAQRRKTTETNKEEKRKAENEKAEAEANRRSLFKAHFVVPCTEAINALWYACPQLLAVANLTSARNAPSAYQFLGGLSSYYGLAVVELALFFRAIELHEALCGKGRWRKLPAVQAFLKPGTNPKLMALFEDKTVVGENLKYKKEDLARYCRESLRAKRAAALRAGRAAKVAP